MSAALTQIAVFASGRGTNFDAIRGAVSARRLDAEIVALVSDNPDAPAVAKAKAAGIRTVVRKPEGASGPARRRAHEEALLAELGPLKPRFIVLAGYMRLFSPEFVREFR